MTALYDRVVEVLLPNPLDRVGVNGLMNERVYMIATTLHPLRMEWHDSMGDAMRRRGEVAEILFRDSRRTFRSRRVVFNPASATENSQSRRTRYILHHDGSKAQILLTRRSSRSS